MRDSPSMRFLHPMIALHSSGHGPCLAYHRLMELFGSGPALSMSS